MAGDQEREDNAGRPERLDIAPNALVQIKRRNEARVYSKDVEFSPAQGRGERLGGIAGPEIRRQRRTDLPRVRIRVVDLCGEAVLDVDEIADESDASDDDKAWKARCIAMVVVEDTDERVDPRETERGRDAPGVFEDARAGEVGGGGEEEAVGAEEAGGGGVVESGENGEAEPEIGDGVEGEGLIVLGGGVVEAIEEEPRATAVDDLGGGGAEAWRGNDGEPELADGGGSD